LGEYCQDYTEFSTNSWIVKYGEKTIRVKPSDNTSTTSNRAVILMVIDYHIGCVELTLNMNYANLLNRNQACDI
jgi:hypothetical protein